MPFDGVAFVGKDALGNVLRSTAAPVADRHPAEAPTEAFLPGAPGEPPALRLLREARGLIEAPERWTQGKYEAEDRRYCAVGALRAASRRLGESDALRRAHRVLLQIAIRRGFQSVERMNDDSSHHHVVSAFDEAIRKLECERMLPTYLR